MTRNNFVLLCWKTFLGRSTLISSEKFREFDAKHLDIHTGVDIQYVRVCTYTQYQQL